MAASGRSRGRGLGVSLRPGRRGAILLTFAAMFASYAFSIHPSSPDRAQRLVYLYAAAPSQAWQLVWWAAALLAVSRAWSRHDAIGFVALEVVATAWAAGQWAALILNGNFGAGAFAALFTAIVVLLRIIDGWVELPRDFLAATDPDREAQ